MVDILFTHSYFLRFDPKEHEAMMPYPPLATLYAASVARRSGYSVALFDSMLAGGEEDIRPILELHRPRVVVIYDDDFNYLTKMCLTRMREAAFTLSAIARVSGCRVIVHGSDPVDHLEDYLTHDADFAICGEGEQTLVELLDHLLRGRGIKESIPGLAYIKDGVVFRNSPRQVIRDLDSLPFPAWDLIDIERYRSVWTKRHGFFSLNMVTTRGCPFHCNWCAKPLYGQAYNSRSPENVIEEMKLLKRTIRPDHIWFSDDIFGLKPGWVQEFSRRVVEQDATIPFKCLARVDLLLKENVIPSLRKARCTSVWVGAESGSQKVLDAMEKGTTVEQIYQATAKLKQAGIRVGFFIQYGYPGESQEDINKTLKMLRDCKPDDIGISVSYPLPGTSFYDRVMEQLGEKHNWSDSGDLDLMYHGTFVPDFYRTLHNMTHKKLRLWQGVDILKEMSVRPWKLSRRKARALAAMAFHWLTLPSFEEELSVLARQSVVHSDR